MTTNMTVQVHGIANCDTVKKARAFLTERGVAFDFNDYKKQGLRAEALDAWLAALGWEALLNRKGNTWRGLDDAARAAATDAGGARQLMLAHTSVIKRPVVVWADGRTTFGFDADDWAARA